MDLRLRPSTTSRGVGMIVAGTALIGVCYGFARFSYGLFAPALRAEFALGSALTGVIGASSYLGYCGAIVLSFVLTARYGARPVAVSAGIVATAGTAIVALAPNGGVLAAGIVIAGSSTGLASPPMAAAIAHWICAERRGRAQSIVNAGTAVGVILSGPITLLLAGTWRWAWGLFAVISAFVTVAIAATVPNTPREFRNRLQRPRFALSTNSARLFAAAFSMGLCSAPIWTFGRDIVVTLGAADATTSTVLWIVIGVSGLAGVAAADLISRLGLRASWTMTLLALAAATVLTALAPTVHPLVFVAAAAFGASYIILCGLLLLWSTAVFPASPAVGVGAAFLFIAIGQAIGAPVAGAMIEHWGYPLAFCCLAAIGCVGAMVRPTGTLTYI